VRRLVAVIVVLLVAGCADSAVSEVEYRDLVAQRSAAYAEEAEELRSSHLFQLEREVDNLVKQTEADALEAAVLDETARRSASLVAAIADAVERYVSDLAAISPPETLRRAHREYVSALNLSIAGIGVTVEALAEAGSFEEIDAAIGGSTFNDTQHRVDAACRNLESALAARGVGADLHCRAG
jgi:hypothetical protein